MRIFGSKGDAYTCKIDPLSRYDTALDPIYAKAVSGSYDLNADEINIVASVLGDQAK